MGVVRVVISNRKLQSAFLTAPEALRLIQGHESNVIGGVTTVVFTVSVGLMSGKTNTPFDHFLKMRKSLHSSLRGLGIPLRMIWVRENATNVGEHVHGMIYLPSFFSKHPGKAIRTRFIGNGPNPLHGALQVRKVKPHEGDPEAGSWVWLAYMLKGVDPLRADLISKYLPEGIDIEPAPQGLVKGNRSSSCAAKR